MALLDVVFQVGVVVVALHFVATPLVVGSDRLRTARRVVRSNLSAVGPAVAVLALVLLINRVVRDIGVELSWILGLNITGHLHAVEGQFVSQLQSTLPPSLTAYFGFVYVFGYAFLLTFPIVAFALYDDPRPLHEILVAYIVNYGLGVLCYVVFVAYGPRNFMPELVEPLLYTNWPQSQLLTSQVNTHTNAFPSLHTSLSVTVAILSYRFRDIYRRWTPVAGLLAASIVVSTMYLGIHWVTVVFAGVLVAIVSVVTATRIGVESYRDRRQKFREYVATRR
jgi:membrane-associated phospholipid phosphatase